MKKEENLLEFKQKKMGNYIRVYNYEWQFTGMRFKSCFAKCLFYWQFKAGFQHYEYILCTNKKQQPKQFKQQI